MAHEKGLTMLSKQGLLNGQSTSKLEFCEHCIFNKHKRVCFNIAIYKTKGILDYIHSDLWEPARTPSKGGTRYMLSFIYDYSRKVCIYFLKRKMKPLLLLKNKKLC